MDQKSTLSLCFAGSKIVFPAWQNALAGHRERRCLNGKKRRI
ncbi:hypothetical protein CLOM621_07329 [Clostridium sp. M62/1]|nr:hypothetical protein CLOM621_07329 [Clostridium sp. M62/1]